MVGYKPNKAFKRDSCRVALWVCSEFWCESGLRKLGLCGIHPLTQRYILGAKNAKTESKCVIGKSQKC
ncbi:DUF3265 domain-containing protein [Vibrio vulnificus]|nr:DUF3265 domain-containing protein [Vibrio vulnificus]